MSNRANEARKAFRNNNLQAARKAHKLHQEMHNTEFTLSDIILGGQDGIVNVLGVVLGIAAASNDLRIVIAGGLAATFAESISMAAVAYTSTLSEAQYYTGEKNREIWEIENLPEQEKEEIRQIYAKKGFTGELLEKVVATITGDKKVWLNAMMEEELKIEPVAKNTAFKSSLIVGVSAIIGSIIPLIPFFFFSLQSSIILAIIAAGTALFLVGVYKAKTTVGSPGRSGVEMMIIGIVSAMVGYLVGLLFKV